PRSTQPTSSAASDVYKRQIHDIGKNIVKMVLENYGFEVIDLGKDVPISMVVETLKKEKICLLYTSDAADEVGCVDL
ncbi:cobalamin-dependent protein, partial [Enterococcus sp. S181_ASV_20]|nr:cobalamin-dependent protein [Enterococcus sp. S181_ASV_20]